MAQYRIRRWFQFGIMDLMLLTALAAVVACLARPVEANVWRAKPWVSGEWLGETAELLLLPDGFFLCDRAYAHDVRSDWQLSRDTARNTFRLDCGTLRFVVRCEDDGERMELLNEDGSVQENLHQAWSLEGPIRQGKPDGRWTTTPVNAHAPSLALEYRNGELVGWYDWVPGALRLDRVNIVRHVRGLPELTARDFRDDK